MRWESLFADLEAGLEAAEAAELAAEVSDRTRAVLARLRLVDRLAAARDAEATVGLRACGLASLSGRLVDLGPDWLLLAEGPGREAVVALAGVLAVSGLGAPSREPGTEGRVESRLGLRAALRGVARDRSPVSVVLVDGSSLYGTIDRVGADFLEVAEHPPGEHRRAGLVRAVRTIPFTALAAVRTG